MRGIPALLGSWVAGVVLAAGVSAASAAASDAAGAGVAAAGAADTAATVWATIGARAVSAAEVDRKAAPTLAQVRRQEYEARRQALDALIEDEVLAREAAARQRTKELLIDTEVATKIPAATTAEVDSFYLANRGRYGGQAKETVAASIAETIRGQKVARARADYVRALRRKYHVRVALEPPRVTLAAGDDPSLGSAKAPVTIVEFSDFQCPFCSRAEATIEDVVARYGDRVRLVYRDFPLDMHSNADRAAQAAECARSQGKYWEMNRAMFADASKLSAADLVETAKRIGLDPARFQGCLDSGASRDAVQKDLAEGRALGITGTPTFFINGIMIVGARELQVFTDVIDDELERAGR